MTDRMGEDFSLARVPRAVRRPLWEVTIIRIGAYACISQVMLGAALGYGLTFWQAMGATFFGSIILQVVSWGVGAAACSEGLSISLLARWAGFGKFGSALIGLAMAISMMGWFGVQNGFFANGMLKTIGFFPFPVWAMITGATVTIITVYGYRFLSLVANITTPLFLIVLGWAAYSLLVGHDIFTLMFETEPAGPRLTMAAAITTVAGGFIAGAVTTPDLSRFMRSPKDVFWMTFISTFVGELLICSISVLMALALRTSEVFELIVGLTGLIGASIVIFSTIKLNDLNLYSSSLGFSTFLNSCMNKKFDRRILSWGLGAFGTLLSILGILDHFIGFLTYLGIAIPPVAAIIVVDYYLLKRDRLELKQGREHDQLPERCEFVNPVTLIAWGGAVLVGWLTSNMGPFSTEYGIPALNSLLVAAVVYWLGMKLYTKFKKVDIFYFPKVTYLD